MYVCVKALLESVGIDNNYLMFNKAEESFVFGEPRKTDMSLV